MLSHVAAQNHYPSSGWGYMWTGDPDRGFGASQPGGWIYNVLPYMGLDIIHDIGKGLTQSQKSTQYAEAISAQMPMFLCPTRRKCVLFPTSGQVPYNSSSSPTFNKTDYAANGGTNQFLGAGPSTSCLNSYPNCTWSNPQTASYVARFNGVSGERSEVKQAQITDGISNTFFAGEKYLDPNAYYTGQDGADNNSNLVGNDWDVNRWGNSSSWMPLQDTVGVDDCWSGFGSAHTIGVHFLYCDGNVRLINYSINGTIYQNLCQRNDGVVNENY
jgi:hypothetical protein